MIILKIKNNAGPGNQMFMYAKAYSLAKKYGHKILIISEISSFSVRQNILQKLNLDKNVVIGFIRLDWIKSPYVFRLVRKVIFDVSLKMPFMHQITQKASESRIYFDDYYVGMDKKIYVIDGYWECHEYFDNIRNDLIKQFKPNYKLDKCVEKMLYNVKLENSVAIHIRKGDFKQFNRLINDDYYKSAALKLRTEIKNPSFYILSEDDEICEGWKKEFGAKRICFFTPTKYIDEWYVMSQCKYYIIANSTYSWWASYLSDYVEKKIIIPSLEEYLEAEKDNTEEMYENYFCKD